MPGVPILKNQKRKRTVQVVTCTTVSESSHIRPVYEDEDYIKYYGYNDGRPYSRNSNKLSKYKLQFPYKKPIVSNQFIDEEDIPDDEENIYEEEEDTYQEIFMPIKPIIANKKAPMYKAHAKPAPPKFIRTSFSYINEEDDDTPTLITKRPIVMEEDDDDFSLHTTNLRKQVHPEFKKQIVSNTKALVQNDDSDDEFESYLKKDDVDDEDQYLKVLKTVQEEMEVTPKRKSRKSSFQEEEEEEYDEEQFGYVFPNKRRNERIYLDLMLYTISGVILIFIMEQFIQIGMKIKTPII
jgi:hypothetical protein